MIRRTFVFLPLIAALFCFTPAWAGGMRCGKELVSIGDNGFVVEQRCGAPLAKNHIGYTINEEKKRELVIEEWIFGPRNGYYYIVTLIGGKVSKIESEHQ